MHSFCYFHFIKAIRQRMKKLNLTKKILNKKCYELLKNIEILSFVDENKLNGSIKFFL